MATPKGSSTKFLELYIQQLVKNTIKEELDKMLPVITESVVASLGGAMQLDEHLVSPTAGKKAPPDRATIRNIMQKHFAVEGDTIAPRNVSVAATFDPVITAGVVNPDPKVVNFLDNLLAGEYNPKNHK